MIVDVSKFNVISSKEASSKGNQPKWTSGGKWYKGDHMGYESLSEVVISALLEKTNVESFVSYRPVTLIDGEKQFIGCVSDNFKKKSESIVTLGNLYRAYNGKSLADDIAKYPEPGDRIKFTVDFVERVTNLENIGKFFTMMLELDAFFLNEDRHTHNIAFIRNDDTKEFKLCPYYDFGLSLLSDTADYTPDEDIYTCIKRIKAKPFDLDFDKQLDAAEELYGTVLRIGFTDKDICSALSLIEKFYEQSIIERVRDILFHQYKKYQYLVKSD